MNHAQRTLVLIVSIVLAAALFTEVSHADTEAELDQRDALIELCAEKAKFAGFSGDELMHEVEMCIANEGAN